MSASLVGSEMCIRDRKKKQAGGFQGRSTIGHKTIIFAAIELDLVARTCAGRSYACVIPNRRRATLQPLFQRI
eukprot:107461-Alexandrium_andersonii.AAC.1